MISKKLFIKINAAVLFSLFLFSAALSANETQKLPMLWDFGAKMCIPCKKMAPILEKMEKEYKGRLVVKFTDVWNPDNVDIAKENKVSSIPTQIFFDEKGNELWRHVGFISEKDILAKWKSLGYDFRKNESSK